MTRRVGSAAFLLSFTVIFLHVSGVRSDPLACPTACPNATFNPVAAACAAKLSPSPSLWVPVAMPPLALLLAALATAAAAAAGGASFLLLVHRRLLPAHGGAAGKDMPIGIVGCGFSGMAMGMYLKKAGYTNFIIFEKAQAIGGTWRDNTYPGCACDIPTHLYSISLLPKSNWREAFAGREEIWSYMQDVMQQAGLTKHMKLGVDIKSARFDEKAGLWRVESQAGKQYSFKVLIHATGPLKHSTTPSLPGLAAFPGKTFHSNSWDHSYDLSGKRVAVVGTGASATQFVPQIQPKVAQLYIFQKSPGWLLPKPNPQYGSTMLAVLKAVPLLLWLHRVYLYLYYELVLRAGLTDDKKRQQVEQLCLQYLAAQVPDPELRAKLTPNYRFGCKRILPSNDYYPALTQPNVELITSPAAKVEGSAVVAADGTTRKVDAIIFATGFDLVKTYAAGIEKVTGLQGHSLQQEWMRTGEDEATGLATGGPEAYYGMAVSGFPNLYLMMGPNSLLGHNSVLVMAEFQAAYILQLLSWMGREGLRYLDVRPAAQQEHNARLQALLAGSVWQSGCTSWYQLGRKGRNFTIWPRNTIAYGWETWRVRRSHYEAVK